MVPLPGSAMPRASQRQFIELAVNMPEHEPYVGQAQRSSSSSSSAVIVPEVCWPTPSKMLIRSTDSPADVFPASIGPPDAKIVGMLHRTAAISMPGTILSQFGMQIIPSNLCASIIVSTASAISSRLGRLYFMPTCPMATPSHTPIVLNSNGTPPACRTASLTNAPTLSRWAWPGITCTNELATAMKGLPKSSSDCTTPVARSKLRCGARSTPDFTMSLLMSFIPFYRIPRTGQTKACPRTARFEAPFYRIASWKRRRTGLYRTAGTRRPSASTTRRSSRRWVTT